LFFILQTNIVFALAQREMHNEEYPFSDSSLTKQRLKELIIHFWPDRKNIISIQIHKTDCDNNWVIYYTQNMPQYMFTNRKITYVYNKNNTCYKVENLVFYRDYLGGGQYGEIHTGYSDDIITVLLNCNH
jgi:hypothetical protein